MQQIIDNCVTILQPLFPLPYDSILTYHGVMLCCFCIFCGWHILFHFELQWWFYLPAILCYDIQKGVVKLQNIRQQNWRRICEILMFKAQLVVWYPVLTNYWHDRFIMINTQIMYKILRVSYEICWELSEFIVESERQSQWLPNRDQVFKPDE